MWKFAKTTNSVATSVFVFILLSAATGCGPREDKPPSSPPLTIAQPARIIGIGRIEPELRLLDLSSEGSGLITALHFRAGDEVAQGQRILELTYAVEQARLEKARATLQSQLSEIEALKAALAATKIQTENANVAFERAKFLVGEDAQAQFTLDNARTEYESLLEEIKRLEANILAAQDRQKQLQAERKLVQAEMEKRFLVAPVDGRILSLDVTTGSFISAGSPIGTFAPESPLCARCEIDELFADYVSEGQQASVRYPGMTEPLAEGTVIFAGPFLRKKSLFADDVGDLEDRRVREILIRLAPDAEILFGSRVECVIPLSR